MRRLPAPWVDMNHPETPTPRQCFLFLQGPISPFFADLARLLETQGHRVLRVNLNFGDWLFWRGPAINYRGSTQRWPGTITELLKREAVTDLLLLGEQRPHHRAAIAAAHNLGIRITVFDYGYLRPDWITCEPEGMGALSRFPRDMDTVRTLACGMPPQRYESTGTRIVSPDRHGLMFCIIWPRRRSGLCIRLSFAPDLSPADELCRHGVAPSAAATTHRCRR